MQIWGLNTLMYVVSYFGISCPNLALLNEALRNGSLRNEAFLNGALLIRAF